MKNIILSLILLLANSTYAQGPEAREEGFSIDALLTGFAESIEGYKVRTSIKISELDQINTNFSDSFLSESSFFVFNGSISKVSFVLWTGLLDANFDLV